MMGFYHFAGLRLCMFKWTLIMMLVAGVGTVQALEKTEAWRAAINALGPVQIGMSYEQLKNLVGELEQQKGDGEGCAYFTPLNSERDISFMLFEGRLVRVDIYSRKIETLSSLRVGDSAERIKEIYDGSVEVIDRQGIASDELLSLRSGNADLRKYRMVFEVNHGIVTNYRLGLLPYVNWRDGCSGERV